MDYHLGQLVACIDDNLKFTAECPDGMTLPTRGRVYTIRTREYLRFRSGDAYLFLRFEEISNPEYPSIIGPFEPVYDARAFRPLDPRRLEVFRHMLVLVTRRDGVPA